MYLVEEIQGAINGVFFALADAGLSEATRETLMNTMKNLHNALLIALRNPAFVSESLAKKDQ